MRWPWFTLLLALLSGCSAGNNLIQLRPANMTVDRRLVEQVWVRFVPPNDLVVTKPSYRMDGGTWEGRSRIEDGWYVPTSNLSLGKHTVEVRAIANLSSKIDGSMELYVTESPAESNSTGVEVADGINTAQVTIICIYP